MRIDGAVALVTGASSGIGRAAARRLAEHGARVIAAGRNRAALAALTAEIQATALAGDLADPAEPERLARQALERHQRVDILVNNAGLGWAGPIGAIDSRTIAALLNVNMLAPIKLSQALLPGMCERRAGHIVNVGSISGHLGVRREAVYSASKAGLIAFSESLRYELAGTGVNVSLVTPSVVATSFFERRGEDYDRRFPRPIDPERVATAIVRAIRQDRAEVLVPAWLDIPIRLRGAMPGLYRALARRFG